MCMPMCMQMVVFMAVILRNVLCLGCTLDFESYASCLLSECTRPALAFSAGPGPTNLTVTRRLLVLWYYTAPTGPVAAGLGVYPRLGNLHGHPSKTADQGRMISCGVSCFPLRPATVTYMRLIRPGPALCRLNSLELGHEPGIKLRTCC